MATATLTTPETTTGTKIVVMSVHIDASGSTATIAVQVQDSGNSGIRSFSYSAQNAEYTSFCTALGSARAGESGTVANRLQFRVIGWMADNSKLTKPDGTPAAVTVAP